VNRVALVGLRGSSTVSAAGIRMSSVHARPGAMTTTTSSPVRRRRTLVALGSILGRRCLLAGDPHLGSLTADEWDDLVALADEMNVLPTLWGAIREKGLTPPPETGSLLRQEHKSNTVRNLAFAHTLRRSIEALNAVGINPLLFKGGLSLIDGSVTDRGWRWMSDLDMVVPADRLFDAVDCLHGIGFRTLRPAYDAPHELVVAHREMPGPIELHIELGGERLASVLPIAEVFAQSITVEVGDSKALGPSPTHQVLQCILHSSLQNHNHAVGGLPLRQLLTLADLLEQHGDAVDWGEIEAHALRSGLSQQLHAHLWLGHRVLGFPLPQSSRISARSRLHEQRAVVNFMLRWPPVIHRNLYESLRREHIEALYHCGSSPVALTIARARHLAVRLRHSAWSDNRTEALRPRH
jgi:Uncharacterised nucleotidyltransferase